mmetsp:Transcript_7453/g.14094  ORF Transcript_7453/g.14094 Transcript_7453/m.14094 type:complete len:234 (-) Transcript_7453:210-911(-)
MAVFKLPKHGLALLLRGGQLASQFVVLGLELGGASQQAQMVHPRLGKVEVRALRPFTPPAHLAWGCRARRSHHLFRPLQFLPLSVHLVCGCNIAWMRGLRWVWAGQRRGPLLRGLCIRRLRFYASGIGYLHRLLCFIGQFKHVHRVVRHSTPGRRLGQRYDATVAHQVHLILFEFFAVHKRAVGAEIRNIPRRLARRSIQTSDKLIRRIFVLVNLEMHSAHFAAICGKLQMAV